MRKSRLSRSNNQQPNRKRPVSRLFLERLEERRMLATNITQYHVDSQSTGANLTETQLTPSNVNAADFGQLYNTPLDGQIYAEPLVLTNVTVVAGPNTVGTPGTYNSVVFVATENDSLYAINAANGAILWQRTFLDTTNPNDSLPGATSVSTVSSNDVSSGDIYPEIGITGTPVIDPSTNILYVSVATKELVGSTTHFVQRLHAINLGDGTDAAPSFLTGDTTNDNTNNTPIYVSGTGDGSVGGVVQFNALHEADRPALSLVNGIVYEEWASHGDVGPYHGWVVAWNVTNLSTKGMVLSGVLCTDPNGGEGGIWGGGGGLTFDPDENVNGQPAFYFETGNGDPRGGPPPLDANGFPTDDDYYESLVKVEADPTTTATNQNSNGWGLKIVDYFTPYNVNALDDADEDFGSGSPLVLPDSAGIPGHPHLIVAAGKEGTIYLLDRDNLGKFNVNDDNVLNAVYNPSTGITTPPVLINGSLSTPAYYHGTLYWVAGYNSNAWSYIVAPNPAPDPPTVPIATLEPTSETANNNFGYLPGSVMISADGSEDPAGGIAWIMDTNNNELHAYSTLSLSTELWNSGPGSIAGVKFAVPTVANGQVFVGTQNSLQAFGLTGASTPAQAPNAPGNLSAQALSGSAVELNWTDSTVSPNFATNYAIQESTNGVNFSTVDNAGQESTSYTVTGLTQNTTYYFQIVGSNSAGSSGPSNIATAMTTNQTGQTPTAPQGLGATPASGSEVYLTWTNTATNETGFVLTRATNSLFTQNVVTQTLASAPYYYTDGATGLSPGNTYFYKLQATNSSGSSSTSNTASVNIPNVPPAPTNAAAVQSGNSVVLSWTDHAGPFALGYQISRSVDGGPYAIYADRPETSDSPPSTQTFTDTNVPLGHTYSYEIVAENVSGFSAAAYATISIRDIGTDTTTQGTWIGTYGAQGYDIVSGPVSLPSGDTITPAGQSIYTRTTTSTDPRAPAGPGLVQPRRRRLVRLHAFSHVAVNLGDGTAHNLELYFERLGQQGSGRDGAAQRRGNRQGAGHRDDLGVHERRLSQLGGLGQPADHDHPDGRGQRRPQRTVPRRPNGFGDVLEEGYDDAGDVDRHVRCPGLRYRFGPGQPAVRRHDHARRAVHLYLDHHVHRPPRPAGTRLVQPRRRRLVLLHELHRRRQPGRRPGPQPGAVLRRLGQQGSGRDGAAQRRGNRQGAGHRDDLGVHERRLSQLGGLGQPADHDHPEGREQRRPQRTVPRRRNGFGDVLAEGYDDAGDVDGDLRGAGLRDRFGPGQPPVRRHGHARRRVHLYLDDYVQRPTGAAGARLVQPRRRRLVRLHQLHRRRQPGRRPGPQPGALLRRLGQQGSGRDGAAQRRGDRQGVGHRDDLRVHERRLSRLEGLGQPADHDHPHGRGQRRPQRTVPRQRNGERHRDSDRCRIRRLCRRSD